MLFALPSFIKIASHGILDLKLNDSVKGEIADLLSSLPSEYVNYKKEKESLRTSLVGLSDDLLKSKERKKDKIIFFIDELDRCRPTFAISLLEKVKHIFNLPNYSFILSLDKEQLGYSIQTQYGQEMDSEGYLRRFIDFNYNLDESKAIDFIPQLHTNLGYSGLFEGKFLSSSREKFFLEMLKAYCKGFKLSLREIEQLFFNLKIILPNINCEELHVLYTIPFLLIVRIKDFPLYSNFITRKRDVTDLIQYFAENKELEEYFVRRPMENIKIKVIEYLKILYSISPQEVESLQQYFIEQKEKDETVFTLYDDLLNLLRHPHQKRFLKDIQESIELTGRISI